MIGSLGVALLGMFVMQATTPPDISGQWQGEDWGQVVLTQTTPGEYTGTYTDTVANEKGPGKIKLKWSRIERRFNGTWREGEDDRFGALSIRLMDKEIHGASTTDPNSKINPATPRLADLVWIRAETKKSGTGGREVSGAPDAYRIERLTVQEDRLCVSLLIIILGDATLKSLSGPLRQAEKLLGRRVNPAIYTRDSFCERYQRGDPFLVDVCRREKLPVIQKSGGHSQKEFENELRTMVAEHVASTA